MPRTSQPSRLSRRDLLQLSGGTAAAIAACALDSEAARQRDPAPATQDHFYRDDWLGEPWRKPETAVLIHGAEESSTEWYAWIPRMAQEYRVIRPDLPGLGRSSVPAGFLYSHDNLVRFVMEIMDKAGVESAHIVGAKTGGALAMRLAADHPKRVRSLVVAGAPAATFRIENASPIPQRDRLGSRASKEMIEYWEQLFRNANPAGVAGLRAANANFDLARDGVLQRIAAPTLVVAADRSKQQTVEQARAYQRLIPNSRLVVIRSDAYHIAAANADECVTQTLAFLHELSR